MRSYSVLLRHEPLSGNDRTTLEVSTKSSRSRFLSTPGSYWGSLRLPYLRLPNLRLPNLQQVWLTQDQLGAFLAVLSAALYLLYKTRTYKSLCVARKTAVFLAPKPLPLTPSARSLCLYGPCVYSPRRLVSGIRHDQEVRPTRRLHTHTRSKQRDLNYLKPTPSTAPFCAKPYTY